MSRISPMPILKAAQFAPVIADRIRVQVVKGGKPTGSRLSTAQLNTMLRAES